MLSQLVTKASKWLHDRELNRRSAAGLFKMQGPMQWSVETVFGPVSFYAQKPADDFCRALQLKPAQATPSHQLCIDPDTMRWLSQQKRKGLDSGPLYGRIVCGHPENFDTFKEWFQHEPSADAAAELLNMAFKLGRNDDTSDIVAQWARENPRDWCDPYRMVEHQRNDTPCLLGRLANKPYLMQWFVDQQPELKQQITDPDNWKVLHDVVQEVYTTYAIPLWPATIQHAFGIEMDPLAHKMAPGDVTALNIAVNAFVHSPAAQCYFVWKQRDYKMPRLKTQVLDPTVEEFSARLQEKIGADIDRNPQNTSFDNTTVEQLMLGIHLDLDDLAFYRHATSILEPQKNPPAPAPFTDLAPNLFLE